MYASSQVRFKNELDDIRRSGLYKEERIITTPQGAVISTQGKEVINFCANNYLGLAGHPRVLEASKRAVDSHGYGLASVRFICGTQDIHKQLEAKLSEFLGTEDCILYAACFDANGGVFEPLLGAEDAIISDTLNHLNRILIDNEFIKVALDPEETNKYVISEKGRIASQFQEVHPLAMVDLYYKTCKEVLKEKAPNKLYLGSRLHNHYYPEDLSHQKWIVPIAAKYCDVISFNRYRFSPNDLKPHNPSIDKPILIGEFHFGALDRGMLHTGLRSVQNQQQREKAYFEYIKAALENPYLVGAHWFQYGEQAVTGRGDGENYQIGFLDVCDNPYQETIDGCREIGYQMYEVRMKSNEKTPLKTNK